MAPQFVSPDPQQSLVAKGPPILWRPFLLCTPARQKSESIAKIERYGKTMTDSALAKLSLDDLQSLHEQVCSLLEQRIEDEIRKLDDRLDELRRYH